ncbi:hypothetical protein AB832_03485 [Flavobacteriaceae bacterium (ex Bugula neritina AB1)]|nr:hypothetical protein AB832_03485 [Flavobacteriaceae bacterium (ex Bugula neritina AB1)]
MTLQSEFNVSIDGEIIPAIVSFSLKEKVGEHSQFELKIRTDVLEKLSEDNDSILGDSRKFLGKSIAVQITSSENVEGYTDFAFKGIITTMHTQKGFFGSTEDVIIYVGHSSCILLDDGSHHNSFSEMALSDIIADMLGTYDQSKLKVLIALKRMTPYSIL